jgi:hypothetical protein
MPLGNVADAGGTWHQVFADDFNTPVPVGSFPGTTYSAKWNVYPDGSPDTTHNGHYYPSKVLSVIDAPGCHAGCLNMYLHTETINGVVTHCVSAPVPRLPGTTGVAGQSYGRYSVRFHLDAVPGYKTAWLLWPDSGIWPAGGEEDFPDGNLNSYLNAFAHYADVNGGQDYFLSGVPEAGAWHIATIEWGPGFMTFILDGRTLGTSTHEVPVGPMHWVLQTETQLSGGAPSDAASGNVQVDWATMYSRP